MKKWGRRIWNAAWLLVGGNLYLLFNVLHPSVPVAAALLAACPVAFLAVNLLPVPRKSAPTRRIWWLSSGAELLTLFLIVVTCNFFWLLFGAGLVAMLPDPRPGIWVLNLVIVYLFAMILFWNGIIRVYATSAQMGIARRVWGIVLGWIPLVNIWYLAKIRKVAQAEAEFETEKWELDAVRAENEICKTKYPLLLVHGVFFRDSRYLNYWGRIPRELQRNGATVYYGGQQSAASVEDSAAELAAKIRAIVAETGCERVNIIAHSKGGLDSRAALCRQGIAPCVASLTTVNTPHRGCIFAEVLLGKMPASARLKIAGAYNAALRRLGDENPDFLSAVTDLTESACLARNETTPDVEGVLYESVASYCAKAANGKFPLNITYPIVRKYDGARNDGLVEVDSAKWGAAFTLLTPPGKRGISHGDVVDLNRENVDGFDVREFYVNLVASLARRGY